MDEVPAVTEKEGLLPIAYVAIVLGSIAAFVLIIAATVLAYRCCSKNKKDDTKRMVLFKSKPNVRYVKRGHYDKRRHHHHNGLLPEPISQDTKTGSEMSIYTLPSYLRRNHMSHMLTMDRRLMMTKANGSIDRTSLNHHHHHHHHHQRPLTLPPSTGMHTMTLQNGAPVATLQKGSLMRVSATQENIPSTLIAARTSLYPSLPAPSSYHIDSNIAHQQNGHVNTNAHYTQQNGSFRATSGGSLLGTGFQQHSAALDVISEERGLGQQQTIFLDPYSGEASTVRGPGMMHKM